MSSPSVSDDNCKKRNDVLENASTISESDSTLSESQYKENLVIREVSEILTNLPETASKFAGNARKSVIPEHEKPSEIDSSDNDNSSPDDSLSESSNEVRCVVQHCPPI